jgi:hypothetical protein
MFAKANAHSTQPTPHTSQFPRQADLAKGRGNFDEGYPSDYVAQISQTRGTANFLPSVASDAPVHKWQRPRRAEGISQSPSAAVVSQARKLRRGAHREWNGFSTKLQRQTPLNCINSPIIEDWQPEM